MKGKNKLIIGILLIANIFLFILAVTAQPSPLGGLTDTKSSQTSPFENLVGESTSEQSSFSSLTAKKSQTTSEFNLVAQEPAEGPNPLGGLTRARQPLQSTPLDSLIAQGAEVEDSPFKNLIAKETPPKINLNWLYVAAPIFLTIGFLAYVEAKRKRAHIELMRQRQQHNIMGIRNYAITNLRRGFTKEQIRNTLIKNNYTHQEIEEAFKGIR